MDGYEGLYEIIPEVKEKISILRRIFELLNERNCVTLREIEIECDIHYRTAKRYVEFLRQKNIVSIRKVGRAYVICRQVSTTLEYDYLFLKVLLEK